MNEEPIIKVQKNVDKTKHKMVIPKIFIDKYGYSYYMYVYEDKIVIKPLTKKEN